MGRSHWYIATQWWSLFDMSTFCTPLMMMMITLEDITNKLLSGGKLLQNCFRWSSQVLGTKLSPASPHLTSSHDNKRNVWFQKRRRFFLSCHHRLICDLIKIWDRTEMKRLNSISWYQRRRRMKHHDALWHERHDYSCTIREGERNHLKELL